MKKSNTETLSHLLQATQPGSGFEQMNSCFRDVASEAQRGVSVGRVTEGKHKASLWEPLLLPHHHHHTAIPIALLLPGGKARLEPRARLVSAERPSTKPRGCLIIKDTRIKDSTKVPLNIH